MMAANPMRLLWCHGGALETRGLRLRRVLLASVWVIASAGAFGQEASLEPASARALSIVPRVSITETFTDNVRLVNTGRQSDQITELSPGVRISKDSGRLKGVFDYALNQVEYAQSPSLSHSQTALNTLGTLEAIDNWLYVDFSGAIAQQSISAFGTLSNDNAANNANRTEVSNYRLSPYLRGRLGDVANYEARYGRSVTHGDASSVSGVATSDTVVNFNGDSSFRNLGWSVDASRQSIDYSAGRPTEADRFDVGLSYSVTPQVSAFVNAGREFSNYTSLEKETYATNSYGVNWSPSDTSKLSALQGNRSFGEFHSLSFEHRTPRTVWTLTDSRDVSTTPNPISRVQLVNAFLQAKGSTPNAAPVNTGFLTSSVSLMRRQDLSFALLGVRDTVTVIATQSESSRLDSVSTGVDDFTTASVVRQHGLSVSYSHRITPDYSLGVLVSQQITSGDGRFQDAMLKFFNISLTGKVGRNGAASLGVRRAVYSGSAPYDENAVVVNFVVQF